MHTLTLTDYEAYTLLDLAKEHAAYMSKRLDEALDEEARALDTDPNTCGDLVNARATVDHWTKHSVRADATMMKLKRLLGED